MTFDLVVSPLLGILIDNVTSLVQEQIEQFLSVKDELVNLSKTLSIIHDVLQDAEDRQLADRRILSWLKDLKNAAYDAEDILDECMAEALLPGPEVAANKGHCGIKEVISGSFSSCFFDFKSIKLRRTIGKKLKFIKDRFDAIDKERTKFNLHLIPRSKDVESSRRQRETASTLDEPHLVYGRDEDKEYIVNQLLNNINLEVNNHQPGGVSICPILGMGGVGKTTLAQLVLTDKRIASRFEIQSWVCVSEKFDLKTVLKYIIESLVGEKIDLNTLDPLRKRLQELLSGKRFLVVLDDVWSEDPTTWSKLKSSLTCGGTIGSAVIVTTRLETVASLVASLPIFRLEVLSKKDCLSLFKHRAFDVDEEEQYPDLIEIGEEIVKKCGGVPLAAKALGGMLRFRRDINQWVVVRESKLWDLPQDKEDSILPALKLSYNNLSSVSKQCFAYCSIFPKGFEMKIEELIWLWMANGFFGLKEKEHLYDIGNEIFNDLLWRSFFHELDKDGEGAVTCKMHDLVHDLACSITLDEFSTIEAHKSADISVCKSSIRHLSMSYPSSILSNRHNYQYSAPAVVESKFPPLLRTLYQFYWPDQYFKYCTWQLTISNLKCLRVLNLSKTRIQMWPATFDNSKHLRYIDFSWTTITSLPESVSNLKNLQTLKLHACYLLSTLPKDSRKLSNLLHLDIRGCCSLDVMPIGMGKLTQLQILSDFVVGPRNSGYWINELQELNYLRGALSIEGLEHVTSFTEAREANLIGKKSLACLNLLWSREATVQQADNSNNNGVLEVVGVAEGLQPHTNIKMLNIEFYPGVRFPLWMGDASSLPNLVKLEIVNCKVCEFLPSFGQLPVLEELSMYGLDSLKIIGDEFHGRRAPAVLFPSLRKLDIRSCRVLKSLCGDLRQLQLPVLEELIIEKCLELELLHYEFEHLVSLKHLTLHELPKLACLPVVGLPHLAPTLEVIDIKSCSGLTSLPEWLVKLKTSLSRLSIVECENLKATPEGMEHLIDSVPNTCICTVHPDFESAEGVTTEKLLEYAIAMCV